jgi:hypothetical protein
MWLLVIGVILLVMLTAAATRYLTFDCPKFPTGPLLISATGLHQIQFWILSQFLSEVIE